MNPLAPVQQTVWGKLAVSNFFFGGAGGGIYVLAASLQVLYPEEAPSLFAAASLLGPALVLAGFLAVAAEAGRPFRGINVLLNVKRSWMSRELLASLSFVAAALADFLWPHTSLRSFAAVAALACVVSQGFILLRARGIPAWNLSVLPLLFLTSGSLTGIGVLLALIPAFGVSEEAAKHLGMVACGLATLNLGVWFYYLCRPEVAKVLKSWSRVGGVIGFGHVLPVLLILTGRGFPLSLLFMVMASGVAILLGEILLKDALVRHVGYIIEIKVPLPTAMLLGQEETLSRTC